VSVQTRNGPEKDVNVLMDQVRGRAADLEVSREDEAVVTEPPTTTPPAGGKARALARIVLWPLIRFFDPRFRGLAQAIEVMNAHLSNQVAAASGRTRDELNTTALRTQRAIEDRLQQLQQIDDELKTLVEADIDAAIEATTVIGQGVSELRTIAEATEVSVRPLQAALDPIETAVRRIEGQFTQEANARLLESGKVEELNAGAAALLNYAASHRGFAAQRNLWFNSPLSVVHEAGDVTLGNVNERIVEIPYAFRALSAIVPGSKILDVGASESMVSLSLASLGYAVTAIDPRPYPLEHPHLRVVAGEVEQWDADETFAAVLCISTLEHIGVGAYGQTEEADADRAALARMFDLTDPGGILVLTVPVGQAAVNDLERTYDEKRLTELLDAWVIEDVTIAQQVEPTVWAVDDSSDGQDARRVALVTARRP
jgi:2-polyprenyl-3-methyl-5-hydroxy-6-metoxy-1,4-benzoquinol methylase